MYNAFVARQNQHKSPKKQISRTDLPNNKSAKLLGVRLAGLEPSQDHGYNQDGQSNSRIRTGVSELISRRPKEIIDEEEMPIDIFDPSTLKHDNKHKDNSQVSRALVRGVEIPTHISSHDFRPRYQSLELGPKNVFWTKKFLTDKEKAHKTEEYNRNLLFTKDKNPYMEGREKESIFIREYDQAKHFGPAMKLKSTTEGERIFDEIKNLTLIDSKPAPGSLFVHYPDWKKANRKKWISNSPFKISNYVSMKNLELNQSCGVKRSSWDVISTKISEINDNPYVMQPMPNKVFRQSDPEQNIDQKHDWHTYTCHDVMGKNMHVSNSLRTSTLNLVMQGDESDILAKTIEQQYLENQPHTKKVYQISHENASIKKNPNAEFTSIPSQARPTFDMKDHHVLEKISELSMEAEYPLESPKKGLSKYDASVYSQHRKKTQMSEAQKVLPLQVIDEERLRPLYEPPIVTRKVNVLPDFGKIYTKSAVKKHYQAYKETCNEDEKFMPKQLPKNLSTDASIDNDVLEKPWQKNLPRINSQGNDYANEVKKTQKIIDNMNKTKEKNAINNLKQNNEALELNLRENRPKFPIEIKIKKHDPLSQPGEDINIDSLVKEVAGNNNVESDFLGISQHSSQKITLNQQAPDLQNESQRMMRKSYKQVYNPIAPENYKSPASHVQDISGNKNLVIATSPLNTEKGYVKAGKLTKEGALGGIGMYLFKEKTSMLPQEIRTIKNTMDRYFSTENIQPLYY